jgi:Ni,Fe-hydrogenase I small subunit
MHVRVRHQFAVVASHVLAAGTCADKKGIFAAQTLCNVFKVPNMVMIGRVVHVVHAANVHHVARIVVRATRHVIGAYF